MSEKQLIYKEKALEILDDFQSDIENCIPYAYSNARARMAGLYPRSEWIPCSERLPKVDERVLITFRASYRTLVVDGCRKGKDMWDIEEFSNYIYDENVVAWMPLPKPYEETDHE